MKLQAIGFIGLGNMGAGMAQNLLRYCLNNHIEMLVYDISPDAVDALVQQGAKGVADVKSVVEKSEVLFTSLPGAQQVNAVALDDGGIFKSIATDKSLVWFETSTNDIDAWHQLKQKAPDNIKMIDAPVTGGKEGALAGTLTMLLGIDEKTHATYSPVLDSFTKKNIRMGQSGAGYATKLCQLHLNYLVAQGIGEALMLGAANDIELEVLWDVLKNSCAQSYVVDEYIPKVLDGSYDPSFALGLARKDMRLIDSMRAHSELELPLASLVLDSYETAVDTYGYEKPHLYIVKMLEDKYNKPLR